MSFTFLQPPVRSLAEQSRRQLLWLGIVIFIGLFTLVTIFSFYQIEHATDSYMRLEAAKLEQAIISNPKHPLPRNSELSAYRYWDSIPVEFTQLFSKDEAFPGKVLSAERINPEGEREYIYLMYSNTQSSDGIYMLDVEQANSIDSLIQSIFEQTIINAGFMIGVFTLLFFLIIAWMFRNAIQPLNLLVNWSEKIKQHPEEDIDVNFSIKELNDIAQHLLASLQQIKDYNIREQQFLKHASHELRTPLAIIQASLDTLTVRTSPNHPNYAALERASRASNNMILLTQALLWLSRKSNQTIQLTLLNPAKICEELIADMRYLVAGKAIQVRFSANSKEIKIAEDLFRIVLANLIRNAFQHSAAGVVLITINDQSLGILNPVEADTLPSVQSFGLGLQLVQRIATELGWQFDFKINNNKASISLYW